MGKITLCEISLSKKVDLYFTKEQMIGVLNVETDKDLKLSAISITIKGQGYVHWTEQKLRGPGEPRFKDTHHHSASEDYFEHTLVLFGQGSGERLDKCYLPAGRYTYPFQCQLPANIPCSFEGDLGYVRYWVKATIEKGRELIHKTKLPFTVICPLELNSVPDSDVSVKFERQV
ncbi:arrestin domain-containing protein 1-like [Ruditapes philippinarum]|uniref:arrestin domain-containing protein 1-like n=1 Tax=Ruditapes philippinarum TaxID=129788 RepID=UPI00295B8AF0|nr:arrestin domain-containing protein 1-like [Ruditapes philippinarum]